MPTHKKNTLTSRTSQRRTNIYKRVFFSPYQEEIFPTLLFSGRLFIYLFAFYTGTFVVRIPPSLKLR
jgi:hypothetical protein